MTLHRWSAGTTADRLACCAMRRIRTFLLSLALVAAGSGVIAGSAAARGNVLPDATYTTLVQVLDAQIDLPERSVALSPRQIVAESKAICRMLATDDPLLAAHRKQCLASVKTIEPMLTSDCKTDRGCARVWKRMAAAYDEMYDLSVATNKAIDRAVPAGRCRTALRTSRTELRAIREAGRLQADLARAVNDDDERALKALEKRAKRLLKMKVRDPEQIQDAIVDHC
jgi:hypothetical protein